MNGIDLRRLAERAKVTMSGFTLGQRVITVLLLVGLIFGGVAFERWVSAPSYAPLFTSLSATDANSIVNKLRRRKDPSNSRNAARPSLGPPKAASPFRTPLPAQEFLAAPGMDLTSGSDARNSQTSLYDSQLAAAIQTYLDALVGTGHSVVQVNATLNLDKTQTTSEQYVYQKGLPPLSQQSSTETFTW